MTEWFNLWWQWFVCCRKVRTWYVWQAVREVSHRLRKITMIEVIITLKSANGPDRDRPLGVICIANDGTGTVKEGNYNFAMSHSGKFFKKSTKSVYKKGKVKGFKRTLSPYRLLYRVLKEAGMT